MCDLKCIKNFCSETFPHDFIYRAKTLFDCNNTLEHCRITIVTVWDPQVLIKSLVIYCPVCKGTVRPIRWKDGSKIYEGPRKLYGLKEDVLLIYQVLAHDPDILSQTHSFLTEPFLFFHKGGIIRELYEFIISRVNIGITLSDIFALWRQMKYDYHLSLNLGYQKWHGANLRLSQDAFNDSLPLLEIN